MFTKNIFIGCFGSKFLWHLKKNQWNKIEKLKKLQLKNLKSIINYAYNNILYYRKLFKSVNFYPEYLKRIEDIQKIPITTKTDIQRNYLNAIPKNINISKCIEYYTSGSTGIPLKTYKNLIAYTKDTILKAYAFLECGVKLTDKFVSIARQHKSISLPNQILVSFLHETNTIVNMLRNYDPDVIYASPHMLEDICVYNTYGINPRLIFTQAETLTELCRSLVKHKFNIKICDTYGSTELGRLAFECNEHMGLHLITDSAVVEFIDDDEKSVAPGERGNIVATGLYNYTMPMIRYNLGDIGTYTDEKCGCGRNWPLIKNIDGRTQDTLILPSGKKLLPHFLNQCINNELKKHLYCVSQYQIVQEKRNKIIIKIIKGKKYQVKVLYKIIQNFLNLFNRLDEEISVEIDFVEKILHNKSRKFHKIVSLSE